MGRQPQEPEPESVELLDELGYKSHYTIPAWSSAGFRNGINITRWSVSWLKACIIVVALLILTVIFAHGHDAAPSRLRSMAGLAGQPRKGLIMATKKKSNVTWLADVPDDWEVYNYVVDDIWANHTVPRNQGNEAMAYLTFINEHYDNLPDYMVFSHGHQKSWHQPEPFPMILRALDLSVVDALGWASLRCTLQNTCEEGKSFKPYMETFDLSMIIRNMHKYVFRPDDPWYEPLPQEMGVPCCSQFAVTKKQTRKRPLRFWAKLREPFLRDLETIGDWEHRKDHKQLSWRMGGTMEVSWHWWFGMPSKVCLDTSFCRNVLFRNKIHCDGKTWDWFSIKTYKNITCTLDDG